MFRSIAESFKECCGCASSAPAPAAKSAVESDKGPESVSMPPLLHPTPEALAALSGLQPTASPPAASPQETQIGHHPRLRLDFLSIATANSSASPLNSEETPPIRMVETIPSSIDQALPAQPKIDRIHSCGSLPMHSGQSEYARLRKQMTPSIPRQTTPYAEVLRRAGASPITPSGRSGSPSIFQSPIFQGLRDEYQTRLSRGISAHSSGQSTPQIAPPTVGTYALLLQPELNAIFETQMQEMPKKKHPSEIEPHSIEGQYGHLKLRNDASVQKSFADWLQFTYDTETQKGASHNEVMKKIQNEAAHEFQEIRKMVWASIKENLERSAATEKMESSAMTLTGSPSSQDACATATSIRDIELRMQSYGRCSSFMMIDAYNALEKTVVCPW